MKKAILLSAEALSNEKDIEIEVILNAIEQVIARMTEDLSSAPIRVRVHINRETGEHQTLEQYQVVSDDPIDMPEEPSWPSMPLQQARAINPSVQVGELLEVSVPSLDFGRIQAQRARREIEHLVNEAILQKLAQQFQSKVGQLLVGHVKRVRRKIQVIVDLGRQLEAILPWSELIPGENFRVGEVIKAVLTSVKVENRALRLTLSRTVPAMLVELFRREVPEIGEEVIEIKSLARDPGMRSKIAVKTNDGRIDPIGACVGMRGARVQVVSNELRGERIDLVLWQDDPVQFVVKAMSPAEVMSIVVDETQHSMDVAVKNEHLPQAIGKNGQNVKLAAELTGWKLNVVSYTEALLQTRQEKMRLLEIFQNELGLDATLAEVLVREGFTSIEDIARVSEHELLEIAELDATLVKALRLRASQAALIRALSHEQPSTALLALKGMKADHAQKLVAAGIKEPADLAELSVDELLDKVKLDRQTASNLIISAREHWFVKASD